MGGFLYRGQFVKGGFCPTWLFDWGLIVRWLFSGGLLPGAFSLEPALPNCGGESISNTKIRYHNTDLKLVSLNIRLLLDNGRQPHRRTARLAHELARYNVDIAALTETRFSEEGEMEGLSRK